MTDIATFTNEQLIAVCRADVAEMSKFLKEGEFSNPSRAAMYLRITEIALAALMGSSHLLATGTPRARRVVTVHLRECRPDRPTEAPTKRSAGNHR
ncbi:hypothetical protein M3O75_18430 [Klebsiella pneumoniae]|nr:hypothetical protein [Klebsiella pneumoniae]